MKKKEFLNNVISKSGMTPSIRQFRKHIFKCLPILAYHRVLNYDENYYQSDIELVSADIPSFEKQIQYLKKHYHALTFNDLYKISNDTYKFQKPPVIITFDDGFSDNYEFAFAILKKYEVPATFFITTDAIDKNIPFWFDLIAYLLLKHTENSINILDTKYTLGNSIELRRKAIFDILLRIKLSPNDEKDNIINEIKQQIPYEDKYLTTTRNMSWDELRIMSENGMEIASHSVTHPILSRINQKQIEYEISYSKKIIEEKLEAECTAFSYPVGGYEEYNSCALEQLKINNYNFACTYEPGINDLRLNDRYQLKRIHIERYTNFNTFKNSLLIPFLA